MKKMIVPVDFSPASLNAAEFAGNLAIFYGAEIWLYHTYDIPVPVGELTYPFFSNAEMQVAAEHELEMMKTQLLGKLRSKIIIHTKVEMGLVTEGLIGFCDDILPDMVVIGLSGKDALTKLIVGSNTIKIVYELKHPVLVIPPKAVFAPPVRKIGFACDYKQIEETTPVGLLKKITKDFNAELFILNLDYLDRNFTMDILNESLGIKNLFRDINPVYDSIESESVTDGLNWYAGKTELNWIVVIPKKHTLLQKIFNRSHTKDLLYHTHLPILCMHQ